MGGRADSGPNMYTLRGGHDVHSEFWLPPRAVERREANSIRSVPRPPKSVEFQDGDRRTLGCAHLGNDGIGDIACFIFRFLEVAERPEMASAGGVVPDGVRDVYLAILYLLAPVPGHFDIAPTDNEVRLVCFLLCDHTH